MTLAPSATWRMLSGRQRTDPMPTGLDALWRRMTGRVGRLRSVRSQLLSEADRALALAPAFEDLDDSTLDDHLMQLREVFARGRDHREDVIRGFALVREAARRELELAAHREQVAGALALFDGRVAEMATGEGKTLTAGLAGVLNAWGARGCHVITANDYLAARDEMWLRPAYARCGLSSAAIIGETSFVDRKRAYAADITHSTSKEIAADFLRDRLVLQRLGSPNAALFSGMDIQGLADQLLQRGLDTAIVDEADSVLIDEAVTPLIISGGGDEELGALFEAAKHAADSLEESVHYLVDHRHREVLLTHAGFEAMNSLKTEDVVAHQGAQRREELVTQALEVAHFYEAGRQYVVQDGRVTIVDESTGRVMPDRSWRDGLHQAIEAREGLEVTGMKETLARISFQRFFRLYRRLSGMTGTAREAQAELWNIYGLRVVSIPTHEPVARVRQEDRIFTGQDEKVDAIVTETARVHESGRPILIGARTVQASELISERLRERDIAHRVLNAVRHAEEAEIVAEAGRAKQVTVATNMAGRGTDIKLDDDAKEAGGLHVIAGERHASARIDRQLEGRAGRQGDPGSSVLFSSLEDELIERYARPLAWLARRGGPLATPALRLAGRLAQWRSGRDGARMRASLLKRDDWLDDALGFAGPGH